MLCLRLEMIFAYPFNVEVIQTEQLGTTKSSFLQHLFRHKGQVYCPESTYHQCAAWYLVTRRNIFMLGLEDKKVCIPLSSFPTRSPPTYRPFRYKGHGRYPEST